MISRTSENALSPEAPKTAADIAKMKKVPEYYLSKVILALAKNEIVASQRGLHGGYDLAYEPENLLLLDVINVVDPIKKIESCPLKLEAHGTNLCALHKLTNDSIESFEEVFRVSTIKTILTEPFKSKALLESY
jgi:Rrf2 family protein|tara:strand:+ start:525 stop:926 length:402 start_codon:yes stop_codon:yes gene_type:complete